MFDLSDAPECKICRKPMRLLDAAAERWYCYNCDLVYYAKQDKWEEPQELLFLTSEEKQNILATFHCNYLGGYDGLQPMDATVILLKDVVHVTFWDSPGAFNVSIQYGSIEVLNLTVAWKPILLTGLISLLISKPRMLNFGFRDNLNVLQIVHFSMEEGDAISCYNMIIEKIKVARSRECESCAKLLAPSAKFCGNCGTAVREPLSHLTS